MEHAKRMTRAPQQEGSLILAVSRRKKARGLLRTRPHDKTLLLTPCSDIHTVGMRYPLDVAFVDEAGYVLETHRNVGPCKRLHNRRAVAVLERFSTCSKPWFVVGDGIGIIPMRSEKL